MVVRFTIIHRAMAQKESHHREVVDDLNGQLAQVRRQFDELTTLSRDQVSVPMIAPDWENQILTLIFIGPKYGHRG